LNTVYFVCAVAGGTLLVLQFLLGLLGLEHHDFDLEVGDVHAADALNLLSVRTLAAGLAFFGLLGMLTGAWGGGPTLALVVALAAGVASALAVAAAQRQLRRLERDGTVRLERAVGEAATVYLSIPGGLAGLGKVHLALQGRTVELQAVSQHPLSTGTDVVVVDVVGPDTVEVTPSLAPEPSTES
jgi:membrane protein implicated in regulation of membrane protease activity